MWELLGVVSDCEELVGVLTGDDGMVLESSLLFFSIYCLCQDVPVFIVFSDVPKYSVLEFTYILLFKK